MALKDILSSIAQDAAKQAAELKREGDEQVVQIKKRWDSEIAKQGELLKQQWQQDAERKVSQSALKLKASGQNKVLEEKQRIIDGVFAESKKKLSSLPEADYVDLLAAQIKDLPKESGILSSTKGKTALLNKALKQSGLSFKVDSHEVEGIGGFIYQAERFSVDNRFEQLLELKRDELRVTLGAILFSNN